MVRVFINGEQVKIFIASDEQRAQIGLAMNEMGGSTQRNAVLVLEASASAEALEVEAEHLSKIIAFFDLGGQSKQQNKSLLKPVKQTQTVNNGKDWEIY